MDLQTFIHIEHSGKITQLSEGSVFVLVCICNVHKDPYTQGFTHTLWCYWEVGPREKKLGRYRV